MTADRVLALPPVEVGLELLGAPLTGYQIAAAAQLNATNPDGTYLWPKVAILWPRQTGKTTLILCTALGRARLPDYRAAYAAQTGHITSQRFKEWNGLIRARPGWARDWRTRDSDGTERITRRATGSYLRAFPPIPGRLRSNALDLVVVDEAQEHDDDRTGADLDADIQPVMDTRPRSQWIVAGTAGDATATYWRRHYDLAAAGTHGHLLLEIGTPPPDADLDDPATWAAHHPGVRTGRTTIAKLQAARDILGPDRFAREYCNQWTQSVADSLFPAGAWRACGQPGAGITGRPHLALELAPDRASAVIAAAGESTIPGRLHVELVATPPLSAVADTCRALAARHRAPIHVDPQSPAVTHLDVLRRSGVPTVTVGLADLIAAAGVLYDRVTQHTLTHLDQPALTAAAATAVRRRLGSRWTFDRYAPGGPTITAAAIAVHAAQLGAGRDPGTPTILAG